jgi:transcription elongation factor Elf1
MKAKKMKILVQKVWWIFTCKVCKSKCQAEPGDVTARPNTDSEGDVVGYIPVVACGHCGKERDVPANKLTPKIKSIATEKGRHPDRSD